GGDGVTFANALEAVDHGVDVPEHLRGGDVRWCLVESPDDLRPEKAPCPDLQAFDPGRGHGLCPEEDASQGFGVDEGHRLDVQAVDGHLAIQGERTNGETVREVRLVLTRATIATRRTGEVGRPVAPQNLGHGDLLVKG